MRLLAFRTFSWMLSGVLLAAPLAATWARPAVAAEERTLRRETGHGPSSSDFPSHQFQWAARSVPRPQVGVNFGLLQLALHGFNAAGEFRYKRLWTEYSHGMALTLNERASMAMTRAERAAGLRLYVPWTTGFGVGATLLDELWLGVEFKAHRYEVGAPGAAERDYTTYSVGPVLGYKVFLWRGLHANAYLRYWPNVATSLDGDTLAIATTGGQVSHAAHDFGVFANMSLGWAFDL